MSHSAEIIVCPNCTSEASGNYCFHCGQETHLHKETLWGMIVHFFAHYFHYDSKFWKTLKMLWLRPGSLTNAYRDKQRMRYIPPISLYIFISAMYFLVSFSHSSRKESHKSKQAAAVTHDIETLRETLRQEDAKVDVQLENSPTGTLNRYFADRSKEIKRKYGDMRIVREKTVHAFPKIFFFMIPVMAFLLGLRFYKRKDFSFADHAVFAIHYHSFWFSVWILRFIHINKLVDTVVLMCLVITVMIYMAVALRRVYNISAPRAVLSTITLGFCYGFFFGIVGLLTYQLYFITV